MKVIVMVVAVLSMNERNWRRIIQQQIDGTIVIITINNSTRGTLLLFPQQE